MPEIKSVLVIGGGIAGATVAQRLSESGSRVHLIDRQAAIGGRVAEMGCKATDVCLRCNVCVANELLRNVATSPDIQIHTLTQLISLEAGSKGRRFKATLRHEPTFIDASKCIGCQACVDKCPEKCISTPKLALPPAVPVIDYSACRRNLGKKCSVCEQICPVDAIDMGQNVSEAKLDVDAIVVATGYEPYNPAENSSYGYGTTVNIITGTEAERRLATDARLTRPSDGRSPKRIAFIQCVGSRSEEVHPRPEDTDYCSTVCCAYALRIAQLAKYLDQDTEVTIFHMDIQNFGKGFDEFYHKCKDGMTFVRSRPYEVKPGQDGSVRVKYAPQTLPQEADSQVCEEDFDLVVLAVGIRPAPDAGQLAAKLLIPVDEQGFFGFKTAAALPALQREGIFVAGACESPKDIQSCMRQAEAVSTMILAEA